MGFPFLAAAVAAQTAGSLASSFLGRKKKGGLSRGDIDFLVGQRLNQINAFESNLTTARQRLLDRVGAFQQAAFRRFVPEAEAAFAGRGLQPGGGAFSSALAKRAAESEENLALQAAQLEREDLIAAENLRGGAFGARFGAQTQLGMFENQLNAQPDELAQAGGQLGALGLMELLSSIRGRTGAGRSVVPSGSSALPLSSLQASRFDPRARLSRRSIDLGF